MPSNRLARVNEHLKREISRILRKEVHDPRVGLVVVMGVEATADLSLARVFVRPGGAEKDWADMMEGLEAAAPFIRRELGKDLKMRKVPELSFREDHTLEKAMRIEEILDEVLPEDGGEDGEGAGGGTGPEDEEEPGAPGEGG